ncbi:hypothetical protein T439DRAFT_379583 [Meredithblackwellia eburnea MCA 4105]
MSSTTSKELVRTAWKDVTIVVSVAGISFLNSFFNGALTVSLVTIQKDLNISAANLQWSVSLYALVFGAFLLPMGRLSDIYGHRTLFILGTAHFAAFSLAISLSPNWIAFTAFCTILALGAAGNTPAGVGVVGAHFEAGEGKNRAFAVLGANQPLGFICGLVIGAVLTQTKAGWRASFYAQSALAVVFGILGFFTIPSSFTVSSAAIPLTQLDSDGQSVVSVNPSTNRKLDWVGSALSVSGFVLLTFALADAQAEPRGWRTPFLPPLIPTSFLLIGAFLYWEKHLDKKVQAYYADPDRDPASPPAPPLLPPAIWRAPFLAALLSIVFFAWASFNTSSYYVNLMMQSVLGVTPLKTALYFLPMIIAGTALNLIPGFLLGKISGKILICTSMALSVVGPTLLALIDIKASYWAFLFPILVFIPAPDLCYAVAAVQISKSVSRSEQATAGALFNVVTRLATAISLGLISTGANNVSENYLSKHPLDAFGAANTMESPLVLLSGYRVAAWACTACSLIGLVLSGVGLSGMGVVGKKEAEVDVDEGDSTTVAAGLTRRRGRRENEVSQE